LLRRFPGSLTHLAFVHLARLTPLQPSLRLNYTTARGYHLVLPLAAAAEVSGRQQTGATRGMRVAMWALTQLVHALPVPPPAHPPQAALPDGVAVQPVRSKSSLAFSTDELLSLNDRCVA
jgi:hypothetical protein